MEKSDSDAVEAGQRYDELYDKANELIQEKNPCKIDGNGVCIRERVRFELFGEHKKNNCCGSPKKDDLTGKGSCKYLGDKGCTIRPLECSLWFCKFIRQWYEGTKFLDGVDKMYNEAKNLDLLDRRKPKEYTVERVRLESKISELSTIISDLDKKY